MKVLGLDLGVGSVGWALLEMDQGGDVAQPPGVIDLGVRIFDPGYTMTQSGEVSRGKERRDARLRRRQLDRKRRRRRKVFYKLRLFGLLPDLGFSDTQEQLVRRSSYFAKLDEKLAPVWRDKMAHESRHWEYLVEERRSVSEEDKMRRLKRRLPYILRAVSASEAVDKETLGRALYHLSLRRGFLSNRKSASADREESEFLASRTQLELFLDQRGQTLGQYLAAMGADGDTLRNQPTTRKMYRQEFNAIRSINEGTEFNTLTKEDWDDLEKAIFYQRPLKSQKHLRGKCSLDPTKTRCKKGRLIAQEYNLRKGLLNLWMRSDSGERMVPNPEQLKLLFCQVWNGTKISEAVVRKTLGLSKEWKWNFDEKEPRSLRPVTIEKVFEALGKGENGKKDGSLKDRGEKWWHGLGEDGQTDLVDNLMSFEKDDAAEGYLLKRFAVGDSPFLTAHQCKNLAHVRFEDEFASLSSHSMRKLLPHLRRWERTDVVSEDDGLTIENRLFGSRSQSIVDRLPPVRETLGELRNPVVERVLSQLRVVVNAVIEKYGRLDLIRIEMARDIKKSRDDRAKIRMTQNQRARDRAKISEILSTKFGIESVRKSDIEKYLLWCEEGHNCAYSGKPITQSALFSNEVEVDHIVPYSRSLDDSFVNKVVCYRTENREKGNKTPYEAFGNDDEKWSAIISNLGSWPKDHVLLKTYISQSNAKKARIVSRESTDTDFSARMLVATGLAAKRAKSYLELLMEKPEKVQVSSGRVTAELRRVCGLEGLLGESLVPGQKARDDHRHHAVDALVIAIAGPSLIQSLASIAASESAKGKRHWKKWREVLGGYQNTFQESVARCGISPMMRSRSRGQLHQETHYRVRSGDNSETLSVRKALPETRVDDKGRLIKRERQDVRAKSYTSIGDGEATRNVLVSSYHHVEIWRKPKGQLVLRFLTLLEAVKLRASCKPLYGILGEKGEQYLMHLHKGSLLRLREGEQSGDWSVEGFDATGNVKLKRLSCALPFSIKMDSRLGFRASAKAFKNGDAIKLKVTPLGETTELPHICDSVR